MTVEVFKMPLTSEIEEGRDILNAEIVRPQGKPAYFDLTQIIDDPEDRDWKRYCFTRAIRDTSIYFAGSSFQNGGIARAS